jgi:uncharacterized membrane protein YbaN (DUF454 family)
MGHGLESTDMGSVGRKPHKGAMKRIAILTVGWICLGLGMVGLFLPVLQGFLLIGFGLWLLSKESTLMKKFADRLKEKYPSQHQRLLAWRSRLQGIFKK